jgi:predicted MFS family arabinose efflux permease
VGIHSRATTMALAFVALQVGRAFGSQLGVPLLNNGSLAANSAIAATAVLIGVLIAWRGVRESKS